VSFSPTRRALSLSVAVASALLVLTACGSTGGGGGGPSPHRTAPHRHATRTASRTTRAPAATRTTNCFSAPGACGYPDPADDNVGVPPAQCSSLPTFHPTAVLGDANAAGAKYGLLDGGAVVNLFGDDITIKGYNIPSYAFQISAGTGDVFDHDCFSESGTVDASQSTIYDLGSASHTTVENSTIYDPDCPVATSASTACRGPNILATDIGGASGLVVDHDILVGSIEAVNGVGAGSSITNNYIVVNAYSPSAHSEDIYAGTGSSQLTVNHNTLLNPFDETAEVFVDNGVGPCRSTAIAVTNNLLAGGGHTIYACSGATGLGSGTFTFTGNDVARCEGTPTDSPNPPGGQQCGSRAVTTTPQIALGYGADSHGYWPGGGYFGGALNVFCGAPGTTWSGNTWDDTGATIACR
jgi:hypothetical protein